MFDEEIDFDSFPPSLSQIRLQGDAVQLNFLPGSPRTTPRFLSLLGGAAGESSLHFHSIYPKLHYIDRKSPIVAAS